MTEISRMAGSIYQPAPLTNWVSQGLKWSKKEAGSLPQSEIEFPTAEIFLFENGEFWCILSGILCDLELQESKQETRYRPGKSKGAGSPTRATRPHFKPWGQYTSSPGRRATATQNSRTAEYRLCSRYHLLFFFSYSR